MAIPYSILPWNLDELAEEVRQLRGEVFEYQESGHSKADTYVDRVSSAGFSRRAKQYALVSTLSMCLTSTRPPLHLPSMVPALIIFACLAMFCIKETEYFNGEDDVVIAKHVLEERVMTSVDSSPGSV